MEAEEEDGIAAVSVEDEDGTKFTDAGEGIMRGREGIGTNEDGSEVMMPLKGAMVVREDDDEHEENDGVLMQIVEGVTVVFKESLMEGMLDEVLVHVVVVIMVVVVDEVMTV